MSIEPTDVGPAAGGHLPVADADRQRCIAVLDAALRDERITPAEHVQRTALARAAKEFDDLVPLTRDLVVAAPTRSVQASTPTSNVPVISSEGANPDTEQLIGIFGGSVRSGKIRLRKSTRVVGIFGGHELDLREATFDDDVCEIDVFCMFGGLEVKVPEGVNVVTETTDILGGTEVTRISPVPGGPTIIIKGMHFCGGTEVKGPRKKGGLFST